MMAARTACPNAPVQRAASNPCDRNATMATPTGLIGLTTVRTLTTYSLVAVPTTQATTFSVELSRFAEDYQARNCKDAANVQKEW